MSGITIPDGTVWRKSSRSTHGACVELAKLENGEVALRNSNRPQLGVITYTREEVAAFLAAAKAKEFDDLVV